MPNFIRSILRFLTINLLLYSTCSADPFTAFNRSAEALHALDQWHDAVSSNIAMKTPGGKQIVLATEIQKSDDAKENRSNAEVLKLKFKRDFTQGPIVNTGNPSHLAIIGDKGFFSIDGGRLFTRDGEFHWNSSNTLVTKHGLPVDGVSGPISKTPNNGPVSFDVLGNVFQGSNSINKIAVVGIEDKEALIPTHGGFVLGEGSGNPSQLSDIEFAPECLENPNGSSIQWMTDLIKLKQAHEAVTKAIAQIDSSHALAINYANSN